ncbi:MAG TPA: Ig-like domain-containing protein [Pseudolabrys sp.]|jgi:hypothetical protein|nr:Ig-like domain-containing protein [Pseudolabrys sp.]
MAINTTSFSNTPQATDDFYSLADYSIVSNQITLNVMADDLGGKAKTLYSVDDGVSSYTTTKIPAPSDLLIKDTPGTFQSFSSLHGAGLGIVDGKVVIDISAADFQTWLASFSGTQTLSFTYAIQLGNGTLSWADVSIEFQGTAVANHAPENTVPGAQSVAEDATLAFTGGNAISVHDTDGNLATTQLTVLNGTLHVDLSGGATISTGANDSATLTLSGSEAQINLALASLTYTGAADYDGNDTLTVVSTDSAGTPLSDTDTIAITVTAVADIADDVATTDEDTAANILVLANDSFEGTPAITGVTQGAHGSVSIDDNSTPGDTTDDFVVYTPDADYNGSDSFTYTVTSGGVDETATVDVTITAVNDAPVGSNDHWIISQQTNAVLPTDAFLANDTDVENDPLSITALSLNGTTWLTDASDGTADGIIHLTTAFGALAVNTITGQVLYDVGGFTGDSTFYYRIDDGQGGIDDAQVTVTAVAVGSGSTADNIDLSAQTYDYSYINPANGGDTVTGGGNAVDIFTGGNGADHLFGSAGDDTINGGGDNDEINGGTGSDTIDGGSGDDTIVGSIGSDQLTGSSGNDTFQYLSILDGADTITDFDGNPSGGQDKIDLQGVLDDYGTSASVILDTNAGDGNDTLVYVNPTGGSSLVGATLMATVNNVTLDASDLQVLVGTTTTVV